MKITEKEERIILIKEGNGQIMKTTMTIIHPNRLLNVKIQAGKMTTKNEETVVRDVKEDKHLTMKKAIMTRIGIIDTDLLEMIHHLQQTMLIKEKVIKCGNA